MRKIALSFFILLNLAAASLADTVLKIDQSTAQQACLNYLSVAPGPIIDSTFTLSGVSGSGHIVSSVSTLTYPPPQSSNPYSYSYSIDLSGLAGGAQHCIRLLIHFGTPESCEGPAVNGDPNLIQSATLAPYGDITFLFAGGCLHPGHPAISFGMLSQAGWKTNYVDVIDDFVNPATGQSNETFTTVKALVPDIAPDPLPWWAVLANLSRPVFQGQLSLYDPTNSVPMLPATNGDYDIRLKVVANLTNGALSSTTVTNRIRITGSGLFHVPIPGEPIQFGDGSVRYLDVAVRPSGGTNDFTQLNSPLPITPAPQALYAFSAGTVADLGPGQAVTTLNGLADAVTLQAGSGIVIGTNGNTLIITAQAGAPSDRNIKTDFEPINGDSILRRVASLPISTWRYTNENAAVRHIGPMAQDFREAFNLGHDDKFIEFVDGQGVALTAIQGLNHKVDQQNAELKQKQNEIDDLKRRLDKVERLIEPSERERQKDGSGK